MASPGTQVPQLSTREQLELAREENKRLRGANREARSQAEPTGLARVGVVGTGGFVAGVLSEVKLGEVMGQRIGADLALPVVSLAIDYGTDGQLPGGAVGKVCRVIRAASDHEISHGAYSLGKWTAQKARTALLA